MGNYPDLISTHHCKIDRPVVPKLVSFVDNEKKCIKIKIMIHFWLTWENRYKKSTESITKLGNLS